MRLEKGKLPIAMPPESISNILDNSRNPAEEELMQSVSIVESAEVTGYNLLLQMAGNMSIGGYMFLAVLANPERHSLRLSMRYT